MPSHRFQFATDTATLLVFDVASLKHRGADDADWWCWPPEEQVREANAGNAAFIDLGADGIYIGTVSLEGIANPSLSIQLACPSGTLFIGAGEEATAEGMEPECLRGGVFLPVPCGAVMLQVTRSGEGCIQLGAQPIAGTASNSLTHPMVLA